MQRREYFDPGTDARKLIPKLNGEEQATTLALLAIADAINNLADEIRGAGTEAQPIHVREA